MFEISIENAKTWKNCVEAIYNLVEEGILEVSAEGISLRSMDPSQIAMVCFSIPKKAFSAYNVEATEKIGLGFEPLTKILARTRGEEKLKMSVEENKLSLDFKSDAGKRSFKVPLIDITGGPQKEPKVEFDAVIAIKAGPFKEILKDAALVSSHVTLEAKDEKFSVEAHGDSADLSIESEKTAKAVESVKVKNKARATFPLAYLDDIARACPDENTLSINLKSNAPAKIEYVIDTASLTYYLAPRIDEE